MQERIRAIGPNHDISVYDTTSLYGEQGNFRVLQFADGAVQGAMDLDKPERVVLEYPRAIMHLMEWNDAAFEDVFVIGHGIGTIAGHYTGKRCIVAELDSDVVELSRRYFGYRGDNVIIGDGCQALERERDHSYDYIVLDAFTEKGTPRHLMSRPFFRMARDKLDPSGALLLNVAGKGGNDPLLSAIHATLCDVFAYARAFALPQAGRGDARNVVMMARDEPIGYQARHMAGFIEIELGRGHILENDGDWQHHF